MMSSKRKIIIVIGIILMLFAGVKIALGINQYHKAEKLYNVAIEEFTKNKTIMAPEKSGAIGEFGTSFESIDVDFDGLQAVNPDICGWIYFENEEISYPLLYSGDNEKYLSRDYTGQYLTAGSIFLEGDNSPDFEDSHTIIYGHNMKNLSMFGRLKYYRTTEDYYENHKYFQIITRDGVKRYRIFAYKEVDANNSIYEVIKSNVSNEELNDFVVEKIINDSYITESVYLEEGAKIATLSTCTKGEGRFVVCGICD